jgi:outer membrane receptor protein involved in Fe transport
LDYARFGSDPFQQNKNIYYDPNHVVIGIPEQFRNANPQVINVYSVKIDYAQPLWKDARMETGAKVSQSKTDNDIKFDVFNGVDWSIDANRTNRFVYTEQIDAVYVNVSQRLSKFNLQAGLRSEYTSLKSEQKTTGEKNDTAYFNLFPTFFVNYSISQKHTFGLSYSRRLSRPGYGLLNPFEIALDAYSFTRGNPNLKPSYTHNIQLSHTFTQSLMTRIAYIHTTDMFMLTPIEDTDTERYGTTYKNFGKSQNVFVMANYRKTLLKIWTANLTVQGGYAISTSDEASGEFVNNGGFFYAQLNNNITITPALSAEITGFYQSKWRVTYLVMQPRGNFSVGLRQTLLKNKMTLSLTVNDIFYTTKEKVLSQYENVNYSMSIGNDNRYASLTLRYNFGSTTVRATRNKTTGIEDEASRAGGR